MTFRKPGRAGRVPRRPRFLVAVFAAIVALVVAILVFSHVWTDYLWFRSLHYTSVFTTELATKALLFVIGGAFVALVVAANAVVAYRLRPPFRPAAVPGIERYRVALDPHRRRVLAVGLVVVGLLTGVSTAAQWRTWLLFAHRTPFGVKDPQFHKDVSFFAFTYPFLRGVLGLLFVAVILALAAAAATHYLYGGIRLSVPGHRTTGAARAHLSFLLGLFMLLKAVAYRLDQYGLAFSGRGVVTGPSYTDVNAVLPAKTILAVIALLCAVLFFAGVVRRGAVLPGAAFGLLVLSAILIGGVYPALIQQFEVRPNEQQKETPYIARNIAATRHAYGIDRSQIIPYSAQTKLTAAQLAGDAATISDVRLLDPNVVSQTFQQLQQVRGFYTFPDALDIDRYPLGGTSPDTVVAVREMAGPPAGQRNWINEHLIYTHGFGFVAALGSQVGSQGDPDFIEGDIPPQGRLGSFQPRVYFGEHEKTYVVVGGGKTPRELDFPDDSAAGQQNTTYHGTGGVPIGSLIDRLLYAIRFREKNLLLSGAINGQSKILYNRTPRERVQQVAPFLTVDGNPYPAVVDHRIVWIVDCYTTSDGYPYSQRIGLAEATRDTNTEFQSSFARQPQDQINYIRNSVKATVDAYDGTVTLYQWDTSDPVLRTWMKAFPHVIKARSDISPDLMRHLRYPEDLFKVQRQILARYHVQDPQSFYVGQDFWQVPQDPTRSGAAEPPYYLSLKMPQEAAPKFSLTTTFVPRGRQNLAAYLAVDSDPADPGYGQLRILELPRSQVIPGPGQVQNTFESDPKVSTQLTLLRGGGSKVVNGNLLTLPFGGGLLYVEPVYVQASASGVSYPTLQRVLVSFGNDIGFGPTLQDALGQVFKGAGGTQIAGGGLPPVAGALAKAVQDARQAYQDGVDALKRGDFAAYGAAQNRLKKALDELQGVSGGS